MRRPSLRSMCLFSAFALALAGCSDSDPAPAGPGLPLELGGARPAKVHLPGEIVAGRAYPLVVLLHGYSVNGSVQDLYLGISKLVTEYDFILVIPEGTKEDPTRGGTVTPEPGTPSHQFWNATEACCNSYGSEVDDVGYLAGLVDEAIEELPIDPARVYFFGHSNGGFMSHRMACDVPERVTAIASLAGATFKDFGDCSPSEAVSILQIHGTLDDRIPYDGNEVMPSALESVEWWAEATGCDLTAAREGDRLDLDDTLAGDDTDALYFEVGCEPGVDHALFTIVDGSHMPISTASQSMSRRTLEWLFMHEKP